MIFWLAASDGQRPLLSWAKSTWSLLSDEIHLQGPVSRRRLPAAAAAAAAAAAGHNYYR